MIEQQQENFNYNYIYINIKNEQDYKSSSEEQTGNKFSEKKREKCFMSKRKRAQFFP